MPARGSYFRFRAKDEALFLFREPEVLPGFFVVVFHGGFQELSVVDSS